MWRFLQNVPRVLRQTWNNHIRSAPQTVHQEEEHNWHGELLTSPTTTGAKHASVACPNKDSALAVVEVNFDYDWREWRRSHQNSWQCKLGQQHSAFEAIGWGTAVVLGLQLSRLYNALYGNDGEKNYGYFNRRSCPLYRLAYGMPQGRGTVVHILPETSNTKTTGTVLEEQAQNHSESELETNFELFSSESKATHGIQINELKTKQEDLKPGKAELCDEDLVGDVQAVWSEYVALADTYVSISNHILGVQHARAGQYVQAVQYWQAASDAGYAKAQFNLGLCYETGRGTMVDLNQAVHLYQQAAAVDHTQALYNLAVMYLHGLGGLTRDDHQAMQLLEKASKQGLREAQVWLGVLCTKEEHQDYKKAAQQFSLAAENGDAAAQFYLGQCYERGLGVIGNECKAVDLYAQAAKRGHIKAKHTLAEFFENGRGGLPQDRRSALDLYKQASELGHQPSVTNLIQLQSQIEAEEKMSKVDSGFQSLDEVDQTFDLLSTRSKSPLKTSASSPTFTDYIRKHLHKFSFTLDGLSEFRKTGFERDQRGSSSVSSAARFYINEDEDYDERSDGVSDEVFVVDSTSCMLQRSCSNAELNRSFTFDDNRALVCL